MNNENPIECSGLDFFENPVEVLKTLAIAITGGVIM